MSDMTDNEYMDTNKKPRNTASREIDSEIGRRAHMLIWSNRRKQGEVATEIGMSTGSLGLKLKGDRGWAIAELVSLAEALNTTVGYLIGETTDNSVGPEGFEPPTSTVKSPRFAPVVSLDERRSMKLSA